EATGTAKTAGTAEAAPEAVLTEPLLLLWQGLIALNRQQRLLNHGRIHAADRHEAHGPGGFLGRFFQLLYQRFDVLEHRVRAGEDQTVSSVVHANGKRDSAWVAAGVQVAIHCGREPSATSLAWHRVIVDALAEDVAQDAGHLLRIGVLQFDNVWPN